MLNLFQISQNISRFWIETQSLTWRVATFWLLTSHVSYCEIFYCVQKPVKKSPTSYSWNFSLIGGIIIHTRNLIGSVKFCAILAMKRTLSFSMLVNMIYNPFPRNLFFVLFFPFFRQYLVTGMSYFPNLLQL